MRGVLADLDGAAKAVLLVLAAHANDAGRCWPSVARLMRVLGYSERTTRRALSALRDRGLISVAEWRYAQGDGTVYELHLPPDTSGTAPLSSASGGPPAIDDTDPLPLVADPPDTGGRQKNHRKNHQKNQGRARRSSTPTVHPLDGVEPTPPASDPAALARSILGEWWEQQQPRPQQPYPAALKVVTKALRDGWTEAELRQALPDLPTISGGALDYWRSRRRRNGNGHQAPSAAAAVEHAERVMGLRP